MANVKERPSQGMDQHGHAEENLPAPQAATALQTYDFGDDAGKGMEGLSMDEYRVPFIKILDPKSPQCAPKPHGLGAKPGSLFNIATSQMYDGEIGVDFIPCARKHNFVRWKKRNPDGSGGGFVRELETTDRAVLQLVAEQGKFKKLQVPVGSRFADPDQKEDHEIAEGFYLYSILVDPDGDEMRVIMPFTGMQIKKYNSFIGRYDNITYMAANGRVKPPLWAHKWHATTTFEKRGDQSWYGWVIGLSGKKPDGSEDNPVKSLLKMADPLYVAGRQFYALVQSGKVKVDYDQAQDAMGRQPGDDEEMPM